MHQPIITMLSTKALLYTFTMGALVLTVGSVALGSSRPAGTGGRRNLVSADPTRAPQGRPPGRVLPGRAGRAAHHASCGGTTEAPA
jgi:hypothetical protein